MRNPSGEHVGRITTWVGLLAGFVALGVGCSVSPAPTCKTGDTRACVGPAQCAGAQTCLADESGFGACDCGTGGSVGGGSGGGTGGGSSGGVGGTNGKERVLLSTKHVDGGVECPTGGNTVSTGPDVNENGVLDDDEVSSTVSLCDAEAVFQSGVVAGDFEKTPSWNLDKGTGDRFFDFAVTFPTPFTHPPTVVVGLSDLDAARVRVRVEATSIATTGFTLHVFTWSDTLLYGVHANWIAYTR